MAVILVRGQRRKIHRTQTFALPHGEDAERAVTRKVPFVAGIELTIQPRAVVVPQAQLKKMRAMRRKEAALGMEESSHKVAEPPDVSAVDEARLSVESRGNLLVH